MWAHFSLQKYGVVSALGFWIHAYNGYMDDLQLYVLFNSGQANQDDGWTVLT